VLKSDIDIVPGDVISCRGQGRLRILAEEGVTRKGRRMYRILVLRGQRH